MNTIAESPALLVSALAVTLAGCGGATTSAPSTVTKTIYGSSASTSAVTATTTTTSNAMAAMEDWSDRTHAHFTKSADALIAAEDCTDVKCMKAACTTAHNAITIDLKGDLPSPDPKLTDALNSMIDDFDKGMHICMNLPANPTKAQAAQFESYIDKSLAHLEEAKSIMDDYVAAAP